MSLQDKTKTMTAEQLRERYNLDALSDDRKAIKLNTSTITKTNSVINNFTEQTIKDIDNLQNQIDGNITTWFFNGAPTLTNSPASDWKADTDKNNHLGDLYYDQDTGYAYRFALSNGVYSWMKITDTDVTKALAIANAAQDTADAKRRVFTTTPTTPYDVGDLYIDNSKDLYRATISRLAADTYHAEDWILATKYTDDTAANAATAALDAYKTEVSSTYATQAALTTTANGINANVSETTTKVTALTTRVSTAETNITTAQTTADNATTTANTASATATEASTTATAANTAATNAQSSADAAQTTATNAQASATDAGNNAMSALNKFADYATQEYVTTQVNTVNASVNANSANIDVIKETLENGVSKVKTVKGFTFDDNGMTIDATNSPTKSVTDTNGLTVTDKSGTENNELMFAGYDETLKKAIVRVANITIGNQDTTQSSYFVFKNWRIEEITDDTYGEGFAFFYIGQ